MFHLHLCRKHLYFSTLTLKATDAEWITHFYLHWHFKSTHHGSLYWYLCAPTCMMLRHMDARGHVLQKHEEMKYCPGVCWWITEHYVNILVPQLWTLMDTCFMQDIWWSDVRINAERFSLDSSDCDAERREVIKSCWRHFFYDVSSR